MHMEFYHMPFQHLWIYFSLGIIKETVCLKNKKEECLLLPLTTII